MWYYRKEKIVIINVKAVPNAQVNKIGELHNGYLKIYLQAPPREGEANDSLIKFLAKLCSLKKSDVILLQGKGSRYKKIQLPLTSDVEALLNSR